MTTIGLLIVLAGFVSYVFLLFVIQRFTYRTWVFDSMIGLGLSTAFIGWALGGNATVTLSTFILSIAWFVITRHELNLTGSKRLELQVGYRMPAMNLLTTENRLCHYTRFNCTGPIPTRLLSRMVVSIEQVAA